MGAYLTLFGAVAGSYVPLREESQLADVLETKEKAEVRRCAITGDQIAGWLMVFMVAIMIVVFGIACFKFLV
jgi:hypothetical protein